MSGPFETERDARAAAHAIVPPESGRPALLAPQNYLLLERACTAAGAGLGAYDRRVLGWLAGFEDSICAVVAGLVARAAQAGKPGRHTVAFDLSDDAGEAYFVLDTALEDFSDTQRGKAGHECGSLSHELWADRADMMRSDVEAAVDGTRDGAR